LSSRTVKLPGSSTTVNLNQGFSSAQTKKHFYEKKYCEAETQKIFVIKWRGFRRVSPFTPKEAAPGLRLLIGW
jgi:hypothetical protein